MELLNISFENRRNDSDSEETNSLNIIGIRMDKNFLERSLREEYNDKLQEKDEEIEDLREEANYSRQRELNAYQKYKNLQEDFDDYKFFANSRIKGLQNQINKSKYIERDYQNLRDENEVLLDENDHLNNTINRMREDANDNNIRFNQILNQKNKQQGFLMNQLNVFQTANQINMSNVIKLSQQNDSLIKENQRSEEIINLQNSQIIQLQEELEKTKKELENSRILNQPINNNNYKDNYNYQSKIINDFDLNFENPNEIELKFISMSQDIKIKIKCSETKLLSNVEEKLLEKCPDLIGKKITYIANGTVLDKSKTVKENKLISDLQIIMNIEDVKQEDNQENNYNNNNINNYDYNNYNNINNYDYNNYNNINNDDYNNINTNNYNNNINNDDYNNYNNNINNDYNNINNNNNYNNENVFAFNDNQIVNTSSTTPTTYRPENDFSYITESNNQNKLNTSYMPIVESINNYIQDVNIEPNPQNNNDQGIQIIPINIDNQINNDVSQISVVPNISEISVVPNVNFYNPINENDTNQINMNSSQISVVPNLDLISQSIENNSLIEINNNISVVPNVIYSSISPYSINQLNNISIVPQVVKLQNYENNNIDEF